MLLLMFANSRLPCSNHFSDAFVRKLLGRCTLSQMPFQMGADEAERKGHGIPSWVNRLARMGATFSKVDKALDKVCMRSGSFAYVLRMFF